jgi:alkanesulfonate monooxygenase SsuD/methylene tetrahydromethanopterin reductase-like flavin-dependent oxidoreductase (luciferase family)
VRALLHGEEVSYTLAGETRDIKFLHRGMGFFDVEHPVPIYVAANGPLALEAAGAYGDGRISAGNEPPEVLASSLARVERGAEKAGRALPDFHTAALTYSCVLQPGEKATSERVIEQVGSMATAGLHFWWELAQQRGTDEFIQPQVRDLWDRYLRYLDSLEIPAERLHLRVHEGHCTYLHPDERQFVTPELIRASGGLVGEPAEILDALRAHERAGLNEVTLLPPMACARECFSEFAKHVIEEY